MSVTPMNKSPSRNCTKLFKTSLNFCSDTVEAVPSCVDTKGLFVCGLYQLVENVRDLRAFVEPCFLTEQFDADTHWQRQSISIRR